MGDDLTDSTYIAGKYDVIVVGAGHAGCEAALAAARLGFETIMFAMNLDTVANMPCNPSIGGTAKGHLVKEIDALGGEMGRNTDKSFIQSKMLNASKGPAVFSLRAQVDRRIYQIKMKQTLEKQKGLHIRQNEITEVIFEETGAGRRAVGVKTATNAVYYADAVILTTGTYLKGRIIIGDISYSGGPDGIFPANRLSESLTANGIALQRFKTGTPARVNRNSIDFSKMEPQPGDDIIEPFSFASGPLKMDQALCHLTYTNAKTHDIIRANLHRSPLFSGDIKGTGPRYCPSIEDKVVRFADKGRHQIFIEPMGTDTDEMYLQGMSSSLPEEVQTLLIHSLEGLEDAKIMRPAYAIEYDCIDPLQLKPSLEFKDCGGLFAAGQINGSSGYEEAAAQGMIAGINAALKLKCAEPLILDRSQAYIGVLIDDLVTKGTAEPYRMMTSRAEYRLLLRQDNADFRLTPIGHGIGLISDSDHANFTAKWESIKTEIERVSKTFAQPEAVNAFLREHDSTELRTGVSLAELLRRPELTYAALAEIDADRPVLSLQAAQQVEISIKYEGYIKRQIQQVEQFKKLEGKRIPPGVDFNLMTNLQTEARIKLSKIRPESIGQASRISGVNPSDIAVLLVYLEQYTRNAKRSPES